MTAGNFHYGIVGNGQSAALVSLKGAVHWLCLPHFDSPSVFGALLDSQKGGSFAIELAHEGEIHYQQAYLKNTNILQTTVQAQTADGNELAYQITDFMPCWETHGSNVFSHPTLHNPPELVRWIVPSSGEPEVFIHFHPRLNYGQCQTHLERLSATTLLAHCPAQQLLVTTQDSVLDAMLAHQPLRLTQPISFIVSHGNAAPAITLENLEEALQLTTSYWRRWVKACYLPPHYQTEIIRSALALKLLIFQPTGAVAAALTTSLPEILGGPRNWDYRFCWIRDAYFIVNALLKLAKFDETEGLIAYLQYVLKRHQPELSYLPPLFTLHGERVPPVTELHHWEGYRNSAPVRIGNDATDHFQSDVYGEAIMTLYPLFFDERVVRTDQERLWQIVQEMVTKAIDQFSEKDNGIWEFGHLRDHYTFSKLMCWAAVARGLNIARRLGHRHTWRKWLPLRNKMREEILYHAWNPEINAFTQAYGSPHLDASTLLMPTLGFISAKDPRMRSTILLSEEKLMHHGFAFRYTNEDEFGAPENPFLICTFWLIDALAMAGYKRRARRYFENLLQYSNHLGLFSEDIHAPTLDLTGNFPQGYTHAAIIQTAMLLETPS
jgi:GH15 family glucan-1,4-alpha-glucosidase